MATSDFIRNFDTRVSKLIDKKTSYLSTGVVKEIFPDFRVQVNNVPGELILKYSDKHLILANDDSYSLNDTVILLPLVGKQVYVVLGKIINNRKPDTEDNARIKIGTYTGDGAVSKTISVGFRPTYVRIWFRVTGAGSDTFVLETSETIVDDHANGLAVNSSGVSVLNAIKQILDNGFVVSDNSVDDHPNKNTAIYNYMTIGYVV